MTTPKTLKGCNGKLTHIGCECPSCKEEKTPLSENIRIMGVYEEEVIEVEDVAQAVKDLKEEIRFDIPHLSDGCDCSDKIKELIDKIFGSFE